MLLSTNIILYGCSRVSNVEVTAAKTYRLDKQDTLIWGRKTDSPVPFQEVSLYYLKERDQIQYKGHKTDMKTVQQQIL